MLSHLLPQRLLCIFSAVVGLASGTEAASRRGQADAREQIVREAPLPPPRPKGLENGEEGAPLPDESARQESSERETTAAIPLPPPRPTDSPAPATPVSTIEDDEGEEAHKACLERLATLGARAEPLPPVRNGLCGAERPVRLSSLADGLAVSPPATVKCPVAEALARWAQEIVKPEAERTLQSTPVSIQIGTSYECRNQNRQKVGKLSEHAFANAVDVMGFVFEKRPTITVGFLPEGAAETKFLNAVRIGACAHFTTVLGPGSDAAHADHLHLDLRGRKGAFRMCQ
jgi:hypothetical protein